MDTNGRSSWKRSRVVRARARTRTAIVTDGVAIDGLDRTRFADLDGSRVSEVGIQTTM